MFKRYSTNSSNADSGYLFPSIRLLQALESLHAPTVLTAPSLLALQGEPYPVSRDASAPHSLLAAWQHCCKHPVSRLIHIVSSEKSDICGLGSSAGTGSPVRKLKQKSPDIVVLCVHCSQKQLQRFFWCSLYFKLLLYSVHCIKHLWGLHMVVLFSLHMKNHPQKYMHCVQRAQPVPNIAAVWPGHFFL